MRHCYIPLFIFLLSCVSLHAQKNNNNISEKCGTMEFLKERFQQNPALRQRFEQNKIEFNKIISSRSLKNNARLTGTIYIPVVFHVVVNNPGMVDDNQIFAQLDTLNKDFSGTNADSINIPSYFKSLFGKSKIQFCLAKLKPNGDVTNGIDRVITSETSFGLNDAVKHASSGGANSWGDDNYFNVWICALSGGFGYSTFPESTLSGDQGVVIDYGTLPGGIYTHFNYGKALTHETGHYFNLYHIWGDDGGDCWGTDYVDDTPNQANATIGCYSGVKTDQCTPGGNGIMYQNYMDYTNEDCQNLFTIGQVNRMETTLLIYRSELLSSDACRPLIPNNYDAQLKAINKPAQRLCNLTFIPQVIIKNKGSKDLTSLEINTEIDNGTITTYHWTGDLTTYNTMVLDLHKLTTTEGNHVLTVYVSNPNNNTDQNPGNDTLQINFCYFSPVNAVKESFEGGIFPPQGWDIVNPDNSITWEHNVYASKTGVASVKISNFNYSIRGETDELRLPSINIPTTVDSVFLSFQVAAAIRSPLHTINSNSDTLQILVSDDCGSTYKSVYKKWGGSLVTDTLPVTNEFIPLANQWRKDSINLGSYVGSNNLLIAFQNTTGFGNDIYLDDINLRTAVVNPNVKEQGFLVTPNPSNGTFDIQFYPDPNNLKTIQVINAIGQKVAEVNINGNQPSSFYHINLDFSSKGMYTVRAIFTNGVLIKKIIKL